MPKVAAGGEAMKNSSSQLRAENLALWTSCSAATGACCIASQAASQRQPTKLTKRFRKPCSAPSKTLESSADRAVLPPGWLPLSPTQRFQSGARKRVFIGSISTNSMRMTLETASEVCAICARILKISTLAASFAACCGARLENCTPSIASFCRHAISMNARLSKPHRRWGSRSRRQSPVCIGPGAACALHRENMAPSSHLCGVTWHLILSAESDFDERIGKMRSRRTATTGKRDAKECRRHSSGQSAQVEPAHRHSSKAHRASSGRRSPHHLIERDSEAGNRQLSHQQNAICTDGSGNGHRHSFSHPRGHHRIDGQTVHPCGDSENRNQFCRA